MSSPSQRFAFLLSLMVGTWFFHPVQAGNVEIFDVTNGNNSGPGSLRAAVAEAESSTHQGDLFIRIDAAAVPAITLTTGPIEITDPRIVEISSNINLSRTVIDALQTSRLFVITAPDSELRFLRLVLQNGQTSVDAASTATCAPGTGRGGAICSLGAVEFQDSTLVDNRTLGNGAHGGAVFAAGWIELGGFCFSPGGCLYTGNSTEGDNAHGGALFSESLVLIDRSDNRLQNHRFSQNHLLGASSRGGAIHAPRVLVQPFSGTDNSANSDQEPVRFETNGADTGGAIFLDCASVDPNATSVLAQVGFISNVAQRAGGALAAINQCRVRIDRGRFELNQCFDFGGGAVFSDGELDLSYSLWSQNSSPGREEQFSATMFCWTTAIS